MRRIGAILRAFFDSPALLCGTGLFVVAVASRCPWLPLPRCLWKTWLGVPCPGCGLTRACLELMRGEFAAAWELHPWAFLLVPVASWYAVRPLWRRKAPTAPEGGVSPKGGVRVLPIVVMLVFSLWAVWRAVHQLPE